MKIWLKLLIGIVAGILLGIFVPDSKIDILFLEKFSSLAVNIGRYILFPLILFSVIMGIYHLNQNKKVLKLFIRTIVYMLIATAALAAIGTASVLVLSPERIPIFIEESSRISLPGLFETLMTIFPKNFFRALFIDGNQLLPVFIMAVLVGFNLNFDKVVTRTAVQVFDSLKSVFYHINSFIIELLGIIIIPSVWYITAQISRTAEIAPFTQMLLAILIDIIFIIFVLYPVIIYLLTGRKNPYRYIYAALAPSLAALSTGDSLFCLGLQIKNSRENMGSTPDAGSVNLPFLAVFGKAGTAMITGISFIVILKSYSSLGLNLSGVLWVITFSFLSSFIISPFPGSGVFVAVSMLCTIYGRGLEEGYLILKPVIPVLLSVSVMLDAMTNSLISMLSSKKTGLHDDIPISNFS